MLLICIKEKLMLMMEVIIHLLNYALCLYNKNDLDNAYNILERAERSYEAQKDKLAPKERQFFEENVDKLKKNREGGETGGIEIQEQPEA